MAKPRFCECGRPIPVEEYLTVRGASERYSVSECLIRKAISAGDLPRSTFGRRVLVRVEDMEAELRRNRGHE